ncbi:MAG: dihydrofolate reductase [Bacteroidetes bacterium]|nr:dihydrofolate reductase [Bacteroidota bacterium]
MKISVFIATSLDGFIAREDGAIDWLPAPMESGEDYGYGAFFESVDAIVMGRNTFELVLTFGAWPYGEKPVVVLSSRDLVFPPQVPPSVSQLGGSPESVVRRLSDRGYAYLYIDGGTTIQGFLREGLVDEIIITRIPVLIGSGIPLFGPLEADIPLRHVETRSFESGIVQSRYGIIHNLSIW